MFSSLRNELFRVYECKLGQIISNLLESNAYLLGTMINRPHITGVSDVKTTCTYTCINGYMNAFIHLGID